MSSKGIYAAVSGAMAQSSRLDTIANNLANVNTTGFKKDRQVFSEYLSAMEKPDELGMPRVAASIESFYDMRGGDNAYVNPAGTYTNFEQGGLKPTGSNLDVALDGKGFFEVMTPQGLRFTRNGAMQVSNEGKLVTREGHPILSPGTGDPASRQIQVGTRDFNVSEQGDVMSQGQIVGKMSVVNFQNPDELQKIGSSLYALKGNATGKPEASQARVQQGFTETSNVNVVEEMTDMITANRVFEAAQKAIQAHDQLDDKLINQVGKV